MGMAEHNDMKVEACEIVRVKGLSRGVGRRGWVNLNPEV